MATSTKPQFWLRCETKEKERRAALTPTTAKALIDAGYDITVERDPQRIFADEDYEKVGCKLVPHSSWVDAPTSVPIIGLKELPLPSPPTLPPQSAPLPHTHVHFAHCYKRQGGWTDVLLRYAYGNGTLYDLEFLQDQSGRRVAAFGYHAGFTGAAVGLLALGEELEGGKLGGLEPYDNEDELVKDVKQKVEKAKKVLGRNPRALVIGALGRCGGGAVAFLKKAGLAESDIVQWDMAETAKGGPFQEILDVDVFINCIYLSQKIPAFITKEFIASAGPKRPLRVVVDVSCDTTNPNNPIPIYDINTTFGEPTVRTEIGQNLPPVAVVSIDHLPSLLPREASEYFSGALLPHLKVFNKREQEPVWKGAEELYRSKVEEAKKEVGEKA